jgi:hypothetical protein
VDSERSESGQPIYRHERAAPAHESGGDEALVAAIDAHIARHVGEPARVWHEIVSDYVHVDVHVVEPTDDRPVYTLVTSGMSEQPMHTPRAGDVYAELVIVLPLFWPAPGSAELRDPVCHWPYRLLQDLARLPHEYDTWLWNGHTVPNGDPPEPYAPGTELCAALIAPALTTPKAFDTLDAGDRRINFFGVIPLHADEMQLKLDQGAERLFELFDAARVSEILDPTRPSAVHRRRRGFFRR